MAAIENAAVVKLDATRHGAPTLGVTLTTSRPFPKRPRCGDCDGPGECCMRAFSVGFRRDMAQLVRWLRKELGSIEYLAFIEWTTGAAATSGGRRRMHAHLLVKGSTLDADQARELEPRLSAEWHAITGDAYVVEARELRTPAGAIAYLTLHHHKTEQGPPPGWSGKRLRPSRGYFGQPVGELREEVRATLQEKRTRAKVVAAVHGDPNVPEEDRAEWVAALMAAEIGPARGPELHRCAVQADVDACGEVRHRVVRSLGVFSPQRRPNQPLSSGDRTRRAGVPPWVRQQRDAGRSTKCHPGNSMPTPRADPLLQLALMHVAAVPGAPRGP